MNTVFIEVVTLYCHSHLHDKMLHFFRSYRHCIVASYSVEFCQDFYLLFAHLHKQMKLRSVILFDLFIFLISYYYTNTCEIPGFLLLLKNHIFIARSEHTIFIFHM